MRRLTLAITLVLSVVAFLNSSSVWALGRIYVLPVYDPSDDELSGMFANDVVRLKKLTTEYGRSRECVYNYAPANRGMSADIPELKWKGPDLYPYSKVKEHFSETSFASDEENPNIEQNGRFSVFNPTELQYSKEYFERKYDVFSNVLAALKTCPATSEDALLIYWSGHGALDPSSGEHVLRQKNGRSIARKALLDAAKAVGARLTVLLTDSCASEGRKYKSEVWETAPLVPGIDPLLDELFFNYRGVLDVNASSPGEKGYSYVNWGYANSGEDEPGWPVADYCGGLFSLSLFGGDVKHYADVIKIAFPEALENNTNLQRSSLGAFNVFARTRRSWDDVLDYSKEATNELYHAVLILYDIENDQPNQTIWIRQKPTKISEPADGAVQALFRNAKSASNTRPRPGDVILSANGFPVTNFESLHEPFIFSPDGEVVLILKSARDGKKYYFATRAELDGYSRKLDLATSETNGEVVVASCRAQGTRLDFDPADPYLQPFVLADDFEAIVKSDTPEYLDDLDWDNRPIWRPIRGDALIAVNGVSVNGDESTFRELVKVSPDEILLTFIDAKTNERYFFKTTLAPGPQTRLGLYVYEGNDMRLRVDRCVEGTACTRGRYAFDKPKTGETKALENAYAPEYLDALSWDNRAIWRPIRGDTVLAVNGVAVDGDESTYRQLVKDSPEEILLTLVDAQTNERYFFKTTLAPGPGTRLGLYVSKRSDGKLHVDGCVEGSACTRGRYARDRR